MYTTETAIQKIKADWRYILGVLNIPHAKAKVNGEASYICPFCGHGAHGDGLTFVPGNSVLLKCFGCDFCGDVIEFYRAWVENAQGGDRPSYMDAVKALACIEGLEIEEYRPYTKRKAQPSEKTPDAGKKYEDQYQDYKKNITDPAAVAYLKKRGISLETAQRYWIGYAAAWTNPKAKNAPASPRLIIPAGSGYIARDIRENLTETQKRYAKQNAGEISLFNGGVLYADGAPGIFITEGAIDALSIIEAGGVAIGLNSVANISALLDEIRAGRKEGRQPAAPLLLALDNDKPGRDAERKLAKALKTENVPYLPVDVVGPYKDPNEALTGNRGAFFEAVEKWQKKAMRPDNMAFYVSQVMRGEITQFREDKKPTGFSNLDGEIGGLYPGLYVLAAVTSLGKTTFSLQLADQLAAAGNDVIFFSLEQSRLEMASKSLARKVAQSMEKKDRAAAITSLTIRAGVSSAGLKEAAEAYQKEIGPRLSIIEGNFSLNVKGIERYVTDYIAKTGKRPVVFIDYLQILQGMGPAAQQAKDRVDETVTALKRMARNAGITVFVISSVNRANYLRPIAFESLKESGGIEYTADVVLGLQLERVEEDDFIKMDDTGKRIDYKKALETIPRRLELTCLKNRYGSSGFSCIFEYYPANDLFEEAQRGDFSQFGVMW